MKNANLIFIVSIILTLVALQLFIAPKYSDYLKIKKEVGVLRENLIAIEEHKVETKNAYKKISSQGFEYTTANGQTKYVEYTEDIDGERKNPIIDSAIPDKLRKAALFNLYYSITKSSGVELDKISMSDRPTRSRDSNDINFTKKLDEMNIRADSLNITVVGSYNNFKRFVENLEKSARFVKINSITFKAPNLNVLKGENPEDHFTFDLDTRVYSLNN